MAGQPLGSEWHWTVPEGAEALRADRALLDALSAGEGVWSGPAQSPSRTRIQSLLKAAQVLVDGAAWTTSAPLPEGAQVVVRFAAPKTLEVVPEDRPLDVLFEDEHLLVLNKPQGLTVHPSTTQTEGTLVHALLHHVKDLSGIGGALRPGIVHRLDKDTSGALVITKTDAAHAKLSETFAEHRIERAYWALCYGAPPAPVAKIESTLGRHPKDRKKMAMNVSGGRRAVTHAKLLETYARGAGKPFACWIEARLETGRTHQIRVHLTGQGCSVLGDPVYGVPTTQNTKWRALPPQIQRLVSQLPGQALHARVLGFEHPITGKALRWEAAPPPVWQELLQSLQLARS